MDAIKNYLESMFMNLPNTPEVQKAKFELGQMMEDKYTELIESGKSDNEAVGIVIAEFGNLDELAEELGISSFVGKGANYNTRNISLIDAKNIISDNNKYAVQTALGVLLCIICPVFPMLFHQISNYNITQGNFVEMIGVLLMFASIAVAVGLFIYSTIRISKWNFIKHEACTIDYGTAQYVHNERENYRTVYALLTTVGILLCALCFVPAAILGSLNIGVHSFGSGIVNTNVLGGALLFICIGIGVYMLVAANIRRHGYTRLLSLNGIGTMGSNYVPHQNEEAHYSNHTLKAVMSVYWPTITCIYLCWSFLSFDWYITWIIWPIAGVVNTLIKNLYGDR